MFSWFLGQKKKKKKNRWPEKTSILPDLIPVWKGSLEFLTAGNCIAINNLFLFSKETFSIVVPVSEVCPAAHPGLQAGISLIPAGNWGGEEAVGLVAVLPEQVNTPALLFLQPHPPELRISKQGREPRALWESGFLCMVSARRMDLCSFEQLLERVCASDEISGCRGSAGGTASHSWRCFRSRWAPEGAWKRWIRALARPSLSWSCADTSHSPDLSGPSRAGSHLGFTC